MSGPPLWKVVREVRRLGRQLKEIPADVYNRLYETRHYNRAREHLPPENAAQAIANLCTASDRILFSSSPDGSGPALNHCRRGAAKTTTRGQGRKRLMPPVHSAAAPAFN